MVEKVRLSVDEETGKLLQSVTDGLVEQLSARPSWAADLIQEATSGRADANARAKDVKTAISEIQTTQENQTQALQRLQQSLTEAIQASESRHQELLAQLSRPWWRRLSGRGRR